MANVNLTASAETHAQILQLIALEKLENNKDYTIKSYLEYLVGLAAHRKIDEAKMVEDWNRLVTKGLLPGLSLKEALEGATQLRAVATVEGQGVEGVTPSQMTQAVELGLDVSVSYEQDKNDE